MTVESLADQLIFLDDFGATATIAGSAGITGIFDDHFLMVDDLGLNIESSEPQFLCRTADCTTYNVADGQTCTVNSTNYTITTREDDGTGFTILTLHLS